RNKPPRLSSRGPPVMAAGSHRLQCSQTKRTWDFAGLKDPLRLRVRRCSRPPQRGHTRRGNGFPGPISSQLLGEVPLDEIPVPAPGADPAPARGGRGGFPLAPPSTERHDTATGAPPAVVP